MKPIVYLAGPITGLSYNEAVSWRANAKQALAPEIDCADPMRGVEFLRHETELQPSYSSYPFTTNRGLMRRCHFDVCRSTALLVNLLGAPSRSIGTVMELAWAYHLHKPVVVVMENADNVHDLHPLLLETFDYRVDDLDYALELVRTIVSAD